MLTTTTCTDPVAVASNRIGRLSLQSPGPRSDRRPGALFSSVFEWGGWGSNPRPADYEETGPAAVRAGRVPSLSISAGQLGSGRTGRDRPGRMFPFCSHPEDRLRLDSLRVLAAGSSDHLRRRAERGREEQHRPPADCQPARRRGGRWFVTRGRLATGRLPAGASCRFGVAGY